MVSVVNRDAKELTAVTVQTGDADTAEEMLLVATAGQEHVVVPTDSLAACTNNQRGRISMAVSNILQKIVH